MNQTVSLSAAEDVDVVSGSAIFDVSSAGLATVSVTATEIDNDVQTLVVSPLSVSVNEGGSASLTVRLSNQPSGNVVVNLQRASGDTDLSLSGASSLTFTPANWNVNQTVSLSAAEDVDLANGSADFDVSSAGLATVSVTATEIDNDVQTLVVSPLSVSVNEGGSASFTIRLSSQPSGNVMVNLQRASGDTDLSLSGASSLTFTPANWNVNQTVSLSAAEDVDVVSGSAIFDVSSAGLATVSVTATEIDNDVQTLVVSPLSVSVNEGGSASLTVRLSNQPSGNVVVNLQRASGDTDLSLSGASSLTFTPANWNVNQTVSLSAAEDVDLANGSSIFDVSSAGVATVSVTATEVDNDLVTNQPPIATLAAIASDGFSGVRGQLRTYQVTIADEPVDVAAGFDVSVNWGDGTTEFFTGGETVQISHAFRAAGSFVVSVAVTDSRGATSSQAQQTFTILVTEIQAADVAIGGTDANDTFTFTEPTIGTYGVLLNKKLVTTASVGGGRIRLYGNLGLDTVTALNQGNAWTLSGPTEVLLNSTFGFYGIENLLGGSLNDHFVVLDEASGFASVGGGSGTDTLDYSQRTLGSVVDLSSGAASGIAVSSRFERLVGSPAEDTLIAPNSSNTWNIDGVNSGNVAKVAFAGYESLRGGTLVDSFKFTNATALVTGSIDGGASTDLLTGMNAANSWVVDGANRGTLNGQSFTSVESLTGGTDIDQFVFGSSGSIAGTINGGTGLDQLDLSSLAGPLEVLNNTIKSVQGVIAGFTAIESVSGGASNLDVIRGADVNTAWSINGSGDVVVGGVAYKSFDAIEGGSAIDTLTNISFANTWNIDRPGGGEVQFGGSLRFDGIENLTSGAFADLALFSSGGQILGKLDLGRGVDLVDLTGMVAAVEILVSRTHSIVGVAGAVAGAEQFQANAIPSNQLSGNATALTWNVNPSGLITAGGSVFSGFSTIQGDALVDTVIGPNQDNSWSINGVGIGTLQLGGTLMVFSGIENLTGGTGIDTFSFGPLGQLDGKITGGTGIDRIDLSLMSGPVEVVNTTIKSITGTLVGFATVEQVWGSNAMSDQVRGTDTNAAWSLSPSGEIALSGVSYRNFEIARGGSAVDTLTGPNVTSAWLIHGPGTGTVQFGSQLEFAGMENLIGGTAADHFGILPSGSLSGNLNGGGTAQNSISYATWSSPVTVNLSLTTAGNATQIAGLLSNMTFVYGGSGSDVLVGNASKSSVLVGNGGNDQLTGGTARDILIGGLGVDSLNGLGGDDILVGGSTFHDADDAALRMIFAEWTTTLRTFAERSANIFGNGTTARLNGDTFLNADTVINDPESVDQLMGGLTSDWFFGELGEISDFTATGKTADRRN